jgi:ribosome-associated protein
LTATPQAKELAIVAATAAADKLATDVVAIDVSSHLALSDVFVVCSARNDRQLVAIVENVEDELRKVGQKPLHREGARDANWALLDYPDIVVHVFLAEAREFYRLERLWNDCPVVEIPELSRRTS